MLIHTKDLIGMTGLSFSKVNYYCLLGLIEPALPAARGRSRVFDATEIIFVLLVENLFGTLSDKKKIITSIRNSGLVLDWQDAIDDPFRILMIKNFDQVVVKTIETESAPIKYSGSDTVQVVNLTAICKKYKYLISKRG